MRFGGGAFYGQFCVDACPSTHCSMHRVIFKCLKSRFDMRLLFLLRAVHFYIFGTNHRREQKQRSVELFWRSKRTHLYTAVGRGVFDPRSELRKGKKLETVAQNKMDGIYQYIYMNTNTTGICFVS